MAGTYLAGQSGGALVFTLFPMMWASGEEVIKDGTTANLNSDAAKKIYDAYRDLRETPTVSARARRRRPEQPGPPPSRRAGSASCSTPTPR
ncbi:hypothetical protein [Tessaracoccus coleopterorum]|uniref:hypothetical protein n=1 Tax=Tessaracoccus coleopterorum TaxID=2714950 RepID=UPI0018D3C4B8|nr:hypothetical protein [Tessaracoccus coleopterorum]